MEKKRPIQTIRRGYVEAAIWQNKTDNGPMYNVTFSRTYKDGEELKNSSSFGIGDLFRVARLALLADDYIHQQHNKE